MGTNVVRYTPRSGRGEENQALVEKVFAELAETRPVGLCYETFRLEDGSFLHIASSTVEPNPLFAVTAFQEFQAELGDRLESAPVVTPAVRIGSYS